MIKLSGQSVVKPLAIVFKKNFDNSIFPDIRKKFNIIPVFSIVHDIYASFDCCPSLVVRGIFLDKSKAFDQVYYKGLIYKLQSLGILAIPIKRI